MAQQRPEGQQSGPQQSGPQQSGPQQSGPQQSGPQQSGPGSHDDEPVQQVQLDENQLVQQVQVDEGQMVQRVQVEEPAEPGPQMDVPVMEDEMNRTADADTALISDELTKPLPVDETLYRPEATSVAPVSQSTPNEVEETRVQELSEEERKLAAERAARRKAREEALAAPDQVAPPPPAPVVVTRRTTDRFLGGFGLFVLRLVVAAILAVRGLEIVMNIPAAQESFAQTRLPEPQIMAIVTGVSALAIALALVFGLLVRVAGLGVALIATGALVFVQWGNWSPFVPGRPGFLGELELLLAAVGILFLCVGGGGFGLDRSFRLGRERSRAAKKAAA